MDGAGARKYGWAAPPVVITSLSVLLAASVGLNLWQYGVIQGQRSSDRPPPAEPSVAATRVAASEPRPKTTRADAEKRFDQLYKELDRLSRLSDQVLDTNQRASIPARTNDLSVKPVRVH